MRRQYLPDRAERWRHDPIGVFTGRVSDDGATVIPFSGPHAVEIRGEALPPPGTEVAFVVVMATRRGEPTRFVAKNVRRAR
jgi:hypothetical protein